MSEDRISNKNLVPFVAIGAFVLVIAALAVVFNAKTATPFRAVMGGFGFIIVANVVQMGRSGIILMTMVLSCATLFERIASPGPTCAASP